MGKHRSAFCDVHLGSKYDNSIGRSIMRRRRGGGGGGFADRHALDTADPDLVDESRLQSIIEKDDISDLMARARMMGDEFKPVRRRVVTAESLAEEASTITPQQAASMGATQKLLKIPRRPVYVPGTSTEDHISAERAAFEQWRRDLASLENDSNLVLTPYERNPGIWTQLWRTVEVSDIVFQIIDIREPLLYWCRDLDRYVHEVAFARAQRKRCYLLANKADLVSPELRAQWEAWFERIGAKIIFFSANHATKALVDAESAVRRRSELISANRRRIAPEAAAAGAIIDTPDDLDNWLRKNVPEAELGDYIDDEAAAAAAAAAAEEASPSTAAMRALRLATPGEILELLDGLKVEWRGLPDNANRDWTKKPFSVGFCGFPNVGKSSCMNALLRFAGARHRVAVAATPGKTKHLQTLYVDNDHTMQLVDCPGLVFPSFGVSRESLVAAGIVSASQIRTGHASVAAAGVIARRIPADILSAYYGTPLAIEAVEQARETGADLDTVFAAPDELIDAVALARGFRVDKGLPDPHRGALRILKDYQCGALTFCAPPPPLGTASERIDLINTKVQALHAAAAAAAASADRGSAAACQAAAALGVKAEAGAAAAVAAAVSDITSAIAGITQPGSRSGPNRQPWEEMLRAAGRVEGSDFHAAVAAAGDAALERAIAQAHAGGEPDRRRGRKAVREERRVARKQFVPMASAASAVNVAGFVIDDERVAADGVGVRTIDPRAIDFGRRVRDRLEAVPRAVQQEEQESENEGEYENEEEFEW